MTVGAEPEAVATGLFHGVDDLEVVI